MTFRHLLLVIFTISSFQISAQNDLEISDITWGTDYNIHITFSNDSTSIQSIKALAHSDDYSGNDDQMTYYPVTLDPTFVKSLKDKNINSFNKTDSTVQVTEDAKTLWSALHPYIGGGFIHFVNSLIYSYEAGKLSNTAALMKRPESNWKPKPMTESYKRTKKWKYYIPDNQKLAIKEYNIQKKKNQLGDILLLPNSFTELFTQTNDKKFNELVENREYNKIAIINMMRLLVGSRYLGKDQIKYIQNAVITAVMQYNVNNLPSVVIFDNYNAAVAMTLDKDGYKIGKIVFKDAKDLSQEEANERIAQMEKVINQINEVNKRLFEQRLKEYYGKN